jgi:hypothetical protein
MTEKHTCTHQDGEPGKDGIKGDKGEKGDLGNTRLDCVICHGHDSWLHAGTEYVPL